MILSSGTEVPFGVCVWSTGNTALDFVRQLGLPLSRDGRILVDAQLAVQGAQDVYAMGDCAVNPQDPLPMIAQVMFKKIHIIPAVSCHHSFEDLKQAFFTYFAASRTTEFPKP